MPELIEMPAQKMAVVTSKGDPNTTASEAMNALYGSVYTLKFDLKKSGKETFKVAGLRVRWPDAHLLRLAGLLERSGQAQQALQVHQFIVQKYPGNPDVETAFYRMALCYWNTFRDAESAKNCLIPLCFHDGTNPRPIG